MATCPNCGNQTGEGAVFCDQCGTRIPAPEAAAPAPAPAPAGGSAICPACGAGNVPGEAFCDFCGSPLEAPVPTAEEVPELEAVSTEAELEAVPEAPAEEPVLSEAEGAETAPPADEKPACPACGAEVFPGEAFCGNCGASLAEPPLEPRQVPEAKALEEPPGEPRQVPEAKALEEPPAEPRQVPEAKALEEPPAEPRQVPEAKALEEPPAEPRQVPEAKALQEPPAEPRQVPEAKEVPEPEVEAAPPPPPAPAPAGPPTCPACGLEVEAGDKFCSNCGAVLQEVPPSEPVEEAPAPPPPPAAVGPRLVVATSGAEIPLPASDEILIGREDPVSGIYPDVDLTPHDGEEGGVSRQHARLIVEGGSYFVEDLDSTNFTFVNKQKLAAKTRHPLNDGDEIRCGRVALVLRT
jgi:hypothetical protein